MDPMTTLLDLLPPFAVGQKITATPGDDFYTPRRRWTVTAITCEGDQWRLDADQGRDSNRRITTRWPKDETPRVEVAA